MKNVTKTNVLFTFEVALYLILIYAVRLIPPSVLSMNMRIILSNLVFLVPAFLYVTVLKPDSLSGIHYSIPSPKSVVKLVLITLCIMPLINLINSISTIFVENQAGNALAKMNENPLWLNLVLMAFLPAVCEEYLFRGLIFGGYKKRNPLGAMLMSSLLFGLIHMNINQFLYAFVMGMVMSLIVYGTGTVLSSMIVHFVFNGINVILSYKSAEIISETGNTAAVETLTASDYLTAYAVMTAVAVLTLYLAYRLFVSLCRENRGIENVRMIFSAEKRHIYDESQGRFFDGYVMTGIIMCLIYILLYGIK